MHFFAANHIVPDRGRLLKLSLLAFLLVTTSPIPVEAAFRCALRSDRCQFVYDELRQYFADQSRDRYLYRNMLSSPGNKMVIERSSERLRRRLKQLPNDVGSEYLRLIFCDSADQAAAATGMHNRDVRCQDQ